LKNRRSKRSVCRFPAGVSFFYFIGKFYDLPYEIKNAPRDVHRCVRKLFDYVKSHLAHKVVKPLKDWGGVGELKWLATLF